jgi:hypothetical protein
MKTKIISLLIVVIIVAACGQTAKKAPEKKANQVIMEKINQIIVNDLTQFTSGYVLSKDKINNGDKTFMQTKIRQIGSTDIEFITVYITAYFNKMEGLSIYEPWTKETNRSYPTYTMGVSVDKLNEFFIIFYMENAGNKELWISYEIK